MLDLFFCHGLMTGNTEFLVMDTFCYREVACIPFPIAFLFVRRYRVVNLCLYAVRFQILLQLIPFFTEQGEDVIDAG